MSVRGVVLGSRGFDSPWLWWLPIALGVALYLPSLGHGFVFDDLLVIVNNTYVQRGVTGIPELFAHNYAHGYNGFQDGLYRPLSLVTFAIEQSLFGLDTRVSHLLQVVLYGTVLVLARAVTQTFATPRAAFWVTLLFAVMPIHTEVVANLKSRDEILALLLVLLAVYQYANWLQVGRRATLVTAAIALLAATFSKESALPLTLCLLFVTYWRKPESTRAWVAAIVVIAISWITYITARVLVLGGLTTDALETDGLANSLLLIEAPLDRLATASSAQWLLVAKTWIPIDLSHDYSYAALKPIVAYSAQGVVALLTLVAIPVLGLFGLVRRRIWALGLVFFVLASATSANLFFLINATLAERFAFAPSLGLCWVLVALLCRLKPQTLVSAMLMAWVVIASVLTTVRVPAWRDDLSLFAADVVVQPSSARAHYNYGTALMNSADGVRDPLEAAANHLQTAIAIWPDYPDAINNLGVVRIRLGQPQRAAELLADLSRHEQDYRRARFNLGLAYFHAENWSASESALEHYLQQNPTDVEALFLLAEAEGHQGKLQEAVEHLRQLVVLEPQRSRGSAKLGLALAMMGHNDDAERWLNKSLALDPSQADSLVNLSLLYLNTQRIQQAAIMVERLAIAHPQHARLRELQTWVLAAGGLDMGGD